MISQEQSAKGIAMSVPPAIAGGPPYAGDLKHCPRCDDELPLDAFGVCTSRKDGLNLYCKQCLRARVALSRQASRERKFAKERRKQPFPLLPVKVRQLFPSERVLDSIIAGARTQKQIARETKLTKDEIGDALANLLLCTKQIRTKMIRGERVYFVAEVEAPARVDFCGAARRPNEFSVETPWSLPPHLVPVMGGKRF